MTTVVLGAQLNEDELLFEQVRSCVEDLGGLRQERVSSEGRGWSEREAREARLLTRISELSAELSAAPEKTWPQLEKLFERPLPEGGRWWGKLFFVGSLGGRDALAQLTRLLKLAPLEIPEVRDDVADALALAPHAGIPGAIRPWLRSESAERRFVAVSALGRRNAVGMDELTLLSTDHEEAVVEAAARAMGRTRAQLNPTVLRMLLYRPEEKIVRAALESAFLWRARLGLQRARSLCEEGRFDFADAALFLGLGSEGKDTDLLIQAAAHGSVSAVRGLGWLGDLRAVQTLVGALNLDTLKLGAAWSLQRLLGASIDEDGVPQLDETDPQPFTPAYVAPELVGLLSTEVASWEEFWERHRKRAEPKVRFRLGHPWSLEEPLRVLEAPDSLGEERTMAHLELCVRSGEAAPLDFEGFVAQQKRQLETWRALVMGEGVVRVGARGAWAARWGD